MAASMFQNVKSGKIFENESLKFLKEKFEDANIKCILCNGKEIKMNVFGFIHLA